MADSPKQKRRRVRSDETQSLIEIFLKWCNDIDLVLNDKVTVREEGSCHRFGMIALEDLDEGETVFKIPRNILLEPNTSSLRETVLEFAKTLPEIDTRNKWLPLLLTLLFEHTNPISKWRPYLDLVPSETVLNQPIFWNEPEKEYLTLVGLKDGVESDVTNIEEGYRKFLSPFMDKHKEFFDPKIHTLELYKRLSGFVMAYSFTDNDNVDAKPAMVPMADILNHVSDNNAHLEFGEEFLSMVTTQTVTKGEEVFNTYGNLDNCNLLRSYGFIEESPNPFDEIEISLDVFQDVLNLTDKEWENKIAQFHNQYTTGHVNIHQGFLFNIEAGCSWSEQALYTFFQIVHDKAVCKGTKPDLKSEENNTDTDKNNADIENQETKNNEQSKKYLKTNSNDSSKGSGITVDNSGSKDDEVLESHSDEQSNGDSDTTGDTEGSDSDNIGDVDGYANDSDGSSCDSGETGLDWSDLQELPDEWKMTLKRAASVCVAKITNLSNELSKKFNKSLDTKRIAMVKNISQGHLTILEKVQGLLELET